MGEQAWAIQWEILQIVYGDEDGLGATFIWYFSKTLSLITDLEGGSHVHTGRRGSSQYEGPKEVFAEVSGVVTCHWITQLTDKNSFKGGLVTACVQLDADFFC